MIPLALNPNRAELALVGAGAPALRRLRALRRGGAVRLAVYAPEAGEALAAEAGGDLRGFLPGEAEISRFHALWIAGLSPAEFVPLAEAARRARVLVNVEDEPEYCDFHAVAELRRGDLLLTVSTGGGAPGLAGTIRRNLETCFPPNWEERVAEIAALRQGWRAENLPMAEAARRIDNIVEERCWLPCPKPD
jgi:precorrin-2 dehydrogenase/sirohydrochlorin ferrochelatase